MAASTAQPSRRWWRKRAREVGDAPGRVFLIGLAALALFSAWVESIVHPSLLWLVLTGLGWLVLAVAWLMQFVYAFVDGESRAHLRRAWPRWLVAPVLVAAVAAALFADLPSQARFAVSKDALRATAVEVTQGRAPELGWRGLYKVVAAEPIPGGALLSVSDPAPFRTSGTGGGFAYAPGGEPDSPTGEILNFTHLEGPWYIWSDGL